mmetsp:Transcript_76933/g.225714  ORF Transcript_76933/g.225714 Transcript_76933/m.225714 type:complete len:157 (+) Transcript_76933:118-588(+)
MQTFIARALTLLALAVLPSSAEAAEPAACLAGEACSELEVEAAEEGMDADVLLLQLKEGVALQESIGRSKADAAREKWFWSRRRAAEQASSEQASSQPSPAPMPSWCSTVPESQRATIPGCSGAASPSPPPSSSAGTSDWCKDIPESSRQYVAGCH